MVSASTSSIEDLTLSIFTAPKRTSRTWKAEEVTWGDVLGWLLDPSSERESGGYVFGRFKGSRRLKSDVQVRSAITLDADYAEHDLLQRVHALGYTFAAYTTYHSTLDAPRWRIIFPLASEVGPERYGMICRTLMLQLGAEQFDKTTDQPERFMYMPSAEDEDSYQCDTGAGVLLDPDSFTISPDAWPAPPRPRTKRDPRELSGAAGAFNRVFSISDAIDRFDLPYKPAGHGRWTFKAGHGEAGLIEFEPGLAWSHHESDPAHGHAMNAFDLVRVHRFGHLDSGASESTPIQSLPSQRAMLEFANELPEVTRDLAERVFGVGDEEPDGSEHDLGWKLTLKRNPRTAKLEDDIRNWDLIRFNDPAFRSLRFNVMTDSIELGADLPWREVDSAGEMMTESDRAAFRLYVEREYGLQPKTRFDDILLDTANQRKIDPVKDYLDSLEWDGIERVETCLPGVDVTDYTRLVARKALTAAVARVYEPGVKWDHTLILYGRENLGKSLWIQRMARGWDSELGRVGDKDTLLSMHRSWIVTADEGFTLKRADGNAMKAFLTRTVDVFRPPYGREATPHPRRMVIWGTTNDPDFLTLQEGNRRFLIVDCVRQWDFDALTDDVIDQIWAEAVFLYKSGEPLWISREEEKLTLPARNEHTEDLPLLGAIEEFVNTPVPSDWWERTPDERRRWYADFSDGMEPAGEMLMDRISTIQVLYEMFGRSLADVRLPERREVFNVLKNLPGWKPASGKQRVRGYGPQRVMVRDDA